MNITLNECTHTRFISFMCYVTCERIIFVLFVFHRAYFKWSVYSLFELHSYSCILHWIRIPTLGSFVSGVTLRLRTHYIAIYLKCKVTREYSPECIHPHMVAWLVVNITLNEYTDNRLISFRCYVTCERIIFVIFVFYMVYFKCSLYMKHSFAYE